MPPEGQKPQAALHGNSPTSADKQHSSLLGTSRTVGPTHHCVVGVTAFINDVLAFGHQGIAYLLC